MKSVIYETKGRAREYNELAINLFTGCGHRCIYCYGADVTHQERSTWGNNPRPRVTIEDIEQSAQAWSKRGEDRPILLCFVTDPYQPIEAKTGLTRQTILMLHKYGLKVIILTKGGMWALRDFDILEPGRDVFATTLTVISEIYSQRWEPGAAPPLERINTLMEARRLGIETWVSLEPVIYPAQTLKLVEMSKDYVGHYKVGIMNYHPHGDEIDWYRYGWAIKAHMDKLGMRYYLKKDLRRFMGNAAPEWGGPAP